jgi:DNA-binding CsgD family transcriptional regulator
MGGFSLEAAIAMVIGEAEIETLDTLSLLVDKGLVVFDPNPEGELRYHLLETVRSFAVEQLQNTGDMDLASLAHASYYLSLAGAENARLRSGSYFVFAPGPSVHGVAGRQHMPWPFLVDQEHANMRAALEWAREHDDTVLIRLAIALARYWWVLGYLQEGAQWLELALARNRDADPELRSRALNGLGIMYRQLGDFARATPELEEALALARTLDDPELLTVQLLDLGGSRSNSDHFPEAIELLQEALTLSRSRGDAWGTAAALTLLAVLEVGRARRDDAHEMFAQALPLFRDLGDLRSVIVVDACLAHTLGARGETQRALLLLDEALQLSRKLGQEPMIAIAIEEVAQTMVKSGSLEAGARLLGAADALRQRGHTRTLVERMAYDEAMATVAATFDEELLAEALAQGRQLSREQAFDEAVAFVQRAMTEHAHAEPEPQPTASGPLSTREQEILELLAQGCPNKEIGGRLFISENTVKYHVSAVLAKLGVKSRTEAVGVAVKRGLL